MTLLDSWPTLPPGAWVRPPRRSMPFPLEAEGVRVFSRARHGLWHGVRALGLRPGDEILVPAYHHGSEVEALTRSDLECRFYDGWSRLEPIEEELERLVGERTRALYLIHYLGFPQDVGTWRRWADERGLLLIEDAAQAWLAETAEGPVGSLGDLAVFCLYKTYGVPDGAAAIAKVDLPTPEAPAGGGVVRAGKRHAVWLAGRWPGPVPGPRGRGRYDPERDFALGDPGTGASRVSLGLLQRLADPATAEDRRRRFATLASALGDLLPEPFRDRLPGASPYVFPIEVDHREAAIAALEAAGVRAMNLWSVPHPALPDEGFPRAAALRRRVIGLPVHQEIRPRDLSSIIRATLQARKSGTKVPQESVERRRKD